MESVLRSLSTCFPAALIGEHSCALYNLEQTTGGPHYQPRYRHHAVCKL